MDDLIGRVTFDRDMLTCSPKGLEKWFPVTPVHHMHNYTDIQGDIRIETTLYEKVHVRTSLISCWSPTSSPVLCTIKYTADRVVWGSHGIPKFVTQRSFPQPGGSVAWPALTTAAKETTQSVTIQMKTMEQCFLCSYLLHCRWFKRLKFWMCKS